MRKENTDMLQDTLRILEQGAYQKDGRTVPLKLSMEEMREAYVLLPQDVEDICGRTDFQKVFALGRCGYGCQNKDSFAAAREQYQKYSYLFGKDSKPVLVLNLANPVNPGGGVRNGAKAQEEDLCRKSSLLLSLESSEAAKYYEYNRSLHTNMGSDGMIFTPQVEIIKDENGDLLEDTVIVAVLTCAAPMVKYGKEGMEEAAYEEMVYHRIMGMLKCAGYFGYKNLVLGAWGCGAFRNDARVMSDLFYKALKEMDFGGMRENDFFRRIDFAVLDRTEALYNFKEFYRNFSFDNFYRDENRKEMQMHWREEAPAETPKTAFIAVKGDITKDHGVEAIVNAANTSLLGGGGVDGAIHRAAGPELLEECRGLSGCETGKAKITKAYRLPCEYVIHTPGPRWRGGDKRERELLASCYRSCLELAVKYNIRKIAFPSISTGIYRFPLEEAVKIAVKTAKQFAAEHPGKLDVIKWVLFDDRTLGIYQQELGRDDGTGIGTDH